MADTEKAIHACLFNTDKARYSVENAVAMIGAPSTEYEVIVSRRVENEIRDRGRACHAMVRRVTPLQRPPRTNVQINRVDYRRRFYPFAQQVNKYAQHKAL